MRYLVVTQDAPNRAAEVLATYKKYGRAWDRAREWSACMVGVAFVTSVGANAPHARFVDGYNLPYVALPFCNCPVPGECAGACDVDSASVPEPCMCDWCASPS